MAKQLVGLNEYTDEKEYELVLRHTGDGLIWGFYRSANHQGTISDSQFDVTRIDIAQIENWTEVAREKLQMKFGCYAIFEEDYNQF